MLLVLPRNEEISIELKYVYNGTNHYIDKSDTTFLADKVFCAGSVSNEIIINPNDISILKCNSDRYITHKRKNWVIYEPHQDSFILEFDAEIIYHRIEMIFGNGKSRTWTTVDKELFEEMRSTIINWSK